VVPRASVPNSNSVNESVFGKRVRDSESGQPRSDTVGTTSQNLEHKEGIESMPTFMDVTETKAKELEICPILTQHFVYPFTNHIEPTLVVKILAQNIIMLLDTGAHVSVLPKKLIANTISITEEGHAQRHVKVLGGEEVVLDGPILLDIVICGVHFVHPFFYVDAEIPAIGGYDLLRASHIVIDSESAEVWSTHPDVENQSSIPENVLATVQTQYHPFDGTMYDAQFGAPARTSF